MASTILRRSAATIARRVPQVNPLAKLSEGLFPGILVTLSAQSSANNSAGPKRISGKGSALRSTQTTSTELVGDRLSAVHINGKGSRLRSARQPLDSVGLKATDSQVKLSCKKAIVRAGAIRVRSRPILISGKGVAWRHKTTSSSSSARGYKISGKGTRLGSGVTRPLPSSSTGGIKLSCKGLHK